MSKTSFLPEVEPLFCRRVTGTREGGREGGEIRPPGVQCVPGSEVCHETIRSSPFGPLSCLVPLADSQLQSTNQPDDISYSLQYPSTGILAQNSLLAELYEKWTGERVGESNYCLRSVFQAHSLLLLIDSACSLLKPLRLPDASTRPY